MESKHQLSWVPREDEKPYLAAVFKMLMNLNIILHKNSISLLIPFPTAFWKSPCSQQGRLKEGNFKRVGEEEWPDFFALGKNKLLGIQHNGTSRGDDSL